MTLTISDRAVNPVTASRAGDPAALVPFNIYLDDGDSPSDIIDALAVGPFVTGREPWAKSKNLSRVREDAALAPRSGSLLRASESGGTVARLMSGDGWTLRSVRWNNGAAYVSVTAISEELAISILDEATADVATMPEITNVSIGFWYFTNRAFRTERTIERHPWADIRQNYTASVATAFDRLMALRAEDLRGRLMLLHGTPGTGKTTALRSLATQWRDWCQMDCVLDPERMFADPAYLMQVALGDDGDDEQRWRLLLLEDCDELIRSEAKSASGQSLSRLLNLTDGLLGQGRRVLVAITTNEDIARLHPAAVRPGRCLAQIEVGPLTRDEAVTWLGSSDGIGRDGATLAELYALRNGDPSFVAETPAATGMYL